MYCPCARVHACAIVNGERKPRQRLDPSRVLTEGGGWVPRVLVLPSVDTLLPVFRTRSSHDFRGLERRRRGSRGDAGGILVLGSWVGIRRPYPLFLFLTAPRMVLPLDPSTDPGAGRTSKRASSLGIHSSWLASHQGMACAGAHHAGHSAWEVALGTRPYLAQRGRKYRGRLHPTPLAAAIWQFMQVATA